MASSAGFDLLTNGTATSAVKQWPGGRGLFTAVGTFAGATIKLQYLGADGVTYLDGGPATTLTANGSGLFELPPCPIKCTITGGPPSGVYANVARIIS